MDERPLLEAIVAAPDDDAPRQVYADWLMEKGDPRGELIALSCTLARGEANDEVIERERALLAQHHAAWTAPLRAIASSAGFAFRRGFVEHVQAYDPRTFTAAICDALFEAAPLVRSLALQGGSQRAYEVAASWQRLRSLELFEGGYGDDPIPDDVSLVQLERLVIANSVFEPEKLAARIAATRELAAFAFGVGMHRPIPERDHVLPILVASPALARVRGFALANVPIRDLAPLGELRTIERLALQRCQITQAQLVASASMFPALVALELSDDPDRPQSGEWRVDELRAAFPKLVRLRMRGMQTDPEMHDARGWEPHRDNCPQPVLDEMLRGNKIGAIKEYRSLTGTHLADAKMAVERLWEQRGMGHSTSPFVTPKWT